MNKTLLWFYEVVNSAYRFIVYYSSFGGFESKGLSLSFRTEITPKI